MPYPKSFSKRPFFLLILIILFVASMVNAQEHVHHDEHKHAHDHQSPHNEIAAGLGIAYSSEYQGFDPAFHVHASKGITPFLGLGAGFEMIFAEHLHQSLSAVVSLYPLPLLDISIGAGTVFPSHEESWAFTAHTELSVTWPIGDLLHAGPVIDFGWSPHGYHIISGLHVGFDL